MLHCNKSSQITCSAFIVVPYSVNAHPDGMQFASTIGVLLNALTATAQIYVNTNADELYAKTVAAKLFVSIAECDQLAKNAAATASASTKRGAHNAQTVVAELSAFMADCELFVKNAVVLVSVNMAE